MTTEMKRRSSSLLVADRGGRPIAGARVQLVGEDALFTDGKGVVQFMPVVEAGARVHVSADGHREQDALLVELELSPDGHRLVVLEVNGILHGFVQGLSAGAGTMERATVVAIPSRLHARGLLGTTWTEWLEEPDSISAEAGPDGYFRLEPLDPADKYWVSGGAHCLGLSGPPLELFPTTEPIVLQLDGLLAAVLRLTDEHGLPLRSLAGYVGNGLSSKLSGTGIKDAPLTMMARELAGVPRFVGGEKVFLARRIAPGGGSVHVQGHFPGYAPFSIDLPLLDCVRGIVTHELRLATTASGWGDLVLELPAQSGAAVPPGPIGRVMLKSASNQTSFWPVSIVDSKSLQLRIKGIPCGTYDIGFQPANPTLSALDAILPESIVVSPEGASAQLAASRPHGSVHVRFPDESVGAVRLSLAREDVPSIALAGANDERLFGRPGGRVVVHLEAPVLRWIPAGAYIVRGLSPTALVGRTWRLAVIPGAQCELDLASSP